MCSMENNNLIRFLSLFSSAELCLAFFIVLENKREISRNQQSNETEADRQRKRKDSSLISNYCHSACSLLLLIFSSKSRWHCRDDEQDHPSIPFEKQCLFVLSTVKIVIHWRWKSIFRLNKWMLLFSEFPWEIRSDLLGYWIWLNIHIFNLSQIFIVTRKRIFRKDQNRGNRRRVKWVVSSSICLFCSRSLFREISSFSLSSLPLGYGHSCPTTGRSIFSRIDRLTSMSSSVGKILLYALCSDWNSVVSCYVSICWWTSE